ACRAARNCSTAFTLALSTDAWAGGGAPSRISVTPGSANAEGAKRRREQSTGASFILFSTDTTPMGRGQRADDSVPTLDTGVLARGRSDAGSVLGATPCSKSLGLVDRAIAASRVILPEITSSFSD